MSFRILAFPSSITKEDFLAGIYSIFIPNSEGYFDSYFILYFYAYTMCAKSSTAHL